MTAITTTNTATPRSRKRNASSSERNGFSTVREGRRRRAYST